MQQQDLSNTATDSRRLSQSKTALLILAAVLILMVLRPWLPDWLIRVPVAAILPWDIWLDAIFNTIKDDLGLIHFTRALSHALESVLDVTGNLLYGRNRWPRIGPAPWSAVAVVVSVLAYSLGGWRLAALALFTCVWTASIGQWKLAMQTLSVLVVAAPVAIVIGLFFGILASKSRAFNRALRPVLSVLQTLPFFTYLLPAVIFFKVGPPAAAVATIIFATPPMILMTTLGLHRVSPGILEAGKMGGCSRWQLLFRVQLPSARTDVLVGVNQVIMLCLAMVVLTAFIGMPGLGAKLLAMMGSFKIGRSFEIGITIVLLAITLDRMSKAWVYKQPQHFQRGAAWWQRHKYTLICLLAFALFVALSQLLPILAEVERKQSLSQGKEIDKAIKAFLAIDGIRAVTQWLRWFLNVWVLIPFRNALLWIPTPAFILLIMSLGWWLAGRREALIAALFFSIIAATGWWDRAIITLYTVISAVSIATVIGIPLGIVASRSEKWARRTLLACDTAQTFPSFIYLIPAIMLFGVNDVAVVFSIVIFATVPLTRYTIEGLRTVPAEITEAADMSGANRRQKLLAVQLPLALPTMAVGFNQAINFAFFMVIIAAFIGTQDLGQELQRTLAGTNLGKNFVLGMDVSLMALSFDIIVRKWTDQRKRTLGLQV